MARGRWPRWPWAAASQANQQNQPYPLLLRVLPLAVSGSLEALLYLCMPKRSSEDLVLFAVLCFMVGTVLVEAYEWATTMIFADKLSGRAAKITPHFRANASGYIASFVIWTLLQGVWSEPQEDGKGVRTLVVYSAIRCVCMLTLALCCWFVAPYLGDHLLHGLNEVTQASTTPRRRQWMGLAMKGFVSSVAFGMGTTATVLSGGATLPLTLGITASAISVGGEMISLFAESNGQKSTPSKTTKTRGEWIREWIRSGPSLVVRSPIILPVLLLWMTRSTICSLPKAATDWFVFVLKVFATTICTLQILRPSVPPKTQGKGDDGITTQAITTQALVCIGTLVAWVLLLECTRVVLRPEESLGGILVVVIAVTVVALRSPDEKAWRGLMLLFWVALLVVLGYAACLKLMKYYQVFLGVFYDANGNFVLPSYFGFGRNVARLRQAGRDVMWSICEQTDESPLFGSSCH